MLFRNAFTIALAHHDRHAGPGADRGQHRATAPGAGVLGLAIGFGAQKFVQDINHRDIHPSSRTS